MPGGWTGNSNPIPSVLQPVITSDAYAVGATSTTISLLAASGSIIIAGDPAINCYVNFRNTVCTSTNFLIPAGSSLQYVGAPIAQFTMLSSSGTAAIQILAN